MTDLISREAALALVDHAVHGEGGMDTIAAYDAIRALPAVAPAVTVKPLVWSWNETGWIAYCGLAERSYAAFSEGQKREIEAVRSARILATLTLPPASPEVDHG